MGHGKAFGPGEDENRLPNVGRVQASIKDLDRVNQLTVD